MECCGVSSPLSTDIIDSVMEKLGSSYPLKCLRFTCNKLDKVDSESLQQVWMEHWGGMGKVIIDNNVIKLGVIDA